MEHKVKLEKSKHRGWVAQTDVPLAAPRVLRIETSKREAHGRAAGVSTFASVHKVDGHMITMELFSDYSKTVEVQPAARSTEAVVKNVHALALSKLPEILEEVRAFYVVKDAKDAKEAAQAEQRNQQRQQERINAA